MRLNLTKPALDEGDVDDERDRRLERGFIFEGYRYQTREKDKSNITGAFIAAQGAISAGAQPGDFFWKNPDKAFQFIDADNNLVPMDAQTVIRFGFAALNHIERVTLAGRNLKDMIIAGDRITDVSMDDLWE